MARSSKELAVIEQADDFRKGLKTLKYSDHSPKSAFDTLGDLHQKLAAMADLGVTGGEWLAAQAEDMATHHYSRAGVLNEGLVSQLLGNEADNGVAIYLAVQIGFTLENVHRMVESCDLYKRCGVLAKIVGISERALAHRMKAPQQTLDPDQSAKAFLYAETMEKASAVLGSRQLAESWMGSPARGLDGFAPIVMISNPIGQRLVEDLLTRMDYGVY